MLPRAEFCRTALVADVWSKALHIANLPASIDDDDKLLAALAQHLPASVMSQVQKGNCTVHQRKSAADGTARAPYAVLLFMRSDAADAAFRALRSVKLFGAPDDSVGSTIHVSFVAPCKTAKKSGVEPAAAKGKRALGAGPGRGPGYAPGNRGDQGDRDRRRDAGAGRGGRDGARGRFPSARGNRDDAGRGAGRGGDKGAIRGGYRGGGSMGPMGNNGGGGSGGFLGDGLGGRGGRSGGVMGGGRGGSASRGAMGGRFVGEGRSGGGGGRGPAGGGSMAPDRGGLGVAGAAMTQSCLQTDMYCALLQSLCSCFDITCRTGIGTRLSSVCCP